MSIKSFNIQDDVYKRFSSFCKEHGISMSKQVQMFMESMLEDEPEAKEAYLRKLEKVRKGKFTKVNDFAQRYGLK